MSVSLLLVLTIPASASLWHRYSDAELTRLYGLRDKKHALVARVLPPPPIAYPAALAPQTDPLLQKSVKDLTDYEIDAIVRRTEEKLHAFWAREFSKRGGMYVPVEVIPTRGPSDPRIGIDTGTRYVDGKVYIDRKEVREASATWAPADGSLIEAWLAHEMAHYVTHVTGVVESAYRRAIPDPGHLVLATATKRLPGKPRYPIKVFVEQQAQYLAGVSLRGAGLLRESDPENIYYLSVASGDDYDRLTTDWIKHPFSAGFFRNDSAHGLGKDFAKAIYDGMLPTGNIDKGLRLLGTAPHFKRDQ